MSLCYTRPRAQTNNTDRKHTGTTLSSRQQQEATNAHSSRGNKATHCTQQSEEQRTKQHEAAPEQWEGSNHGTTPTSTTQAPSKPRRPKCNTAPSHHHRPRYRSSNTTHTSQWTPSAALHQARADKGPVHKCAQFHAKSFLFVFHSSGCGHDLGQCRTGYKGTQ